MDWTIAAAAVMGGWMMLSVLTGERIAKVNQITLAAQAAADAAAKPTAEAKAA